MLLRKTSYLCLGLLACFIFLNACKKDPSNYPSGSDEAINQWIYSEMAQYYYWASQLPGNVPYTERPVDFFNQLLAPEDRFSTIVQSLNEETYGKTLANTFGIDLVAVEHANQPFYLISQVVPFSSGALNGLVRGDSIGQVNGEDLNLTNISEILNQALNQNSLSLTLKNGKVINLPASYIAQPVVYTYNILKDIPNAAYLYLSHFDFSGAYDLLNALQVLKSANVQHLILDLRYNPGGQVSFAAFCALLLAPVQANDIFIRYRGNSNMAALDESFSDALARQPDGYAFTFSELASARLPIQRIYILTTGHTASAAELLINNLRPYIDITQIGETTLGKDMASVTRSSPDEVSGNSAKWHILPLVYKMFNSENAGDYQDGIVPQQIVNEYQALPLYPFGDPRDPLLAEALRSQSVSSPLASRRHVEVKSAKKIIHYESRPYEHKPILIE